MKIDDCRFRTLLELRASDLVFSASAARALEEGWQLSRYSEVAGSELHGNYEIRLKHLRTFNCVHSEQLANSVGEFLGNIDEANLVGFASITGNAEYDYTVFRDNKREYMIGVLKNVSKLEVSPERWQELWND